MKFAEPLPEASPKSPQYDIEKGSVSPVKQTAKPSGDKNEEVPTEKTSVLEPSGTGAATSSAVESERYSTYEAREKA